MSTNACLMLMTVMTRQCATTLQARFHAFVRRDGLVMELVVKVRQQNILLKIFFGNVSVSKRLSYERQFLFSDLDECTLNLHNCNDQAMCNNTPGSFSCACNIGWTVNGISCEGMPNRLTVKKIYSP